MHDAKKDLEGKSELFLDRVLCDVVVLAVKNRRITLCPWSVVWPKDTKMILVWIPILGSMQELVW